ncbi:hypothetical protein H257_16342 [Aphanomyces astaci]|uniref:Uncharacterized protein n=1 Tax=Aphanomyces astaci TaxID=112090 RepID=W4FKS1_APHAT|nr:hypothetical protein H257_16342 [Aphanomyces astaci]ETV67481.1 hypothetical protein H257_16342 [Aphanomyces astaci]|eukprot:XP_009843040.1 hypothetical protein H257_16342 [Aphanomyces astaci]
MRKESLRCGRFKELAISADVPVTSTKSEVSALWRAFAQRWLGLCQKHETVRKQILHPHTGNFEPGAMTLVLGEPQSGKSSHMKILSDRFPLTKSAFTWMAESRTTARTRQPQLVTSPPLGTSGCTTSSKPRYTMAIPLTSIAFKCPTDLGYHDLTNI